MQKPSETNSDYTLAHRTIAWFTLLCFTFQPLSTFAAGIVADPASAHRPVIDTTANGLPLVQITTPSAAGVSHNQYTQYNVDPSGVILNNARTVTQTQLGGYVTGNPNLANGSASVILNEVTSSNPSSLRGYTEVAGSRAQVIIANPNGITCDGCGFINTSRGVLTTGTPVFGGSGSLDSFRVTGGSITVGSGGLNASNTDQLDLITRSVQVNGQLWANNLNVITGANLVNYANLGVQIIQGDTNQPTVDIDVALLGGMYANKIRLIGTEAGVGVVSLGNIAAQGGDLNIDNTGKITLKGNTNATGNVALNTQSTLDNSGVIYGQGNVLLSAQNAASNTSTIAAGNNLSITASSLDSNGILGSGVATNGSIGSSGNLTVNTTGSLQAVGQNFAGGNLSLAGTSLDLSNTQTSANGTVTLTASAGDINHSNSSLQTGSTFNGTASGAFNNAGGDIGAAQLTFTAASLGNSNGSLTQSGTGTTTFTLSGNLDNTNGNIASNALSVNLNTGSLVNNSGQLNHAGSGTLAISTGSLSNLSGNISTNGNSSVTAASLDNSSGIITAVGTGNISVSQALTNGQGTLQTGGKLDIAAASVNNNAGRIVSLNNAGLSVTSIGAVTNLTGLTAAGDTGGVIGGNGNVTVNSSGLTSSGNITAQNDLNISSTGVLDNSSGNLAAGGNLTAAVTGALTNAAGSISSNATTQLTAAQIDNTGGNVVANQLTISTTIGGLNNHNGNLTQTGTSATIFNVATALDNTHGNLATNGSTLNIQSGSLTNDQGQIVHAGTNSLVLNTGALSNSSGSIASNGAINISASSIANQNGTLSALNAATISSTGNINSNGGTIVADSLNLTAQTLASNVSGTIQTTNGLILAAQTLDNSSGSLKNLGNSALTLTTTQAITNTSGLIGSNGTASLTAASLNNTSSGTVYGKDNLTVNTTGQINNHAGTIKTDANLTVGAQGALDNTLGTLSASGIGNTASTVTVTAASIDNTTGRLVNSGTGNTNVNGGSQITNNNSAAVTNMGIIGGKSDVSITATNLSNTGGAQITAGNDLTLNTSNSLVNTAGSIYAANDLTLDQASASINNSAGGSIAASRDVTLHAASINNTNGKIVSDRDISLQAAAMTGIGQLIASRDLALNLQGNLSGQSGDLMQSDRDLDLTISGNLINIGSLDAVGNLNITAASINNQSGAEISSVNTHLVATGSLTNRGLIDGQSTIIETGALDNLGTGRIYGDHLAIAATTLTNDVENNVAAVIAARNQLDIGATTITNREHALIFSAGDINIGGGLDSGWLATGQANLLTNSSATIEAQGDLNISTATLNNTNAHFTSTLTSSQTTFTGYNAGEECSSLYNQPGCRGNYNEDHTDHTYTQIVYTPVLDSSDPGKLLATGNITLTGNTLTNDKSQIIAGAALNGTLGNLNNIGATATQSTTITDQYRVWESGSGYILSGTHTFTSSANVVTLPVSQTLSNTAPQGTGTQISQQNVTVANTPVASAVTTVGAGQSGSVTGAAPTAMSSVSASTGSSQTAGSANTVAATTAPGLTTTLPNSSLYTLQTQPGQQYLVETDPRFANYKTFLSSDYMLNQLSMDPQITQKHLGDGYYEQQLVLNQVAQLTGQQLLANNTNSEQQFQALMVAGVSAASQFNLTPGIALTAAQMAALTSDIVWMQQETVTLPDGTTTVVLAPQVYLSRLDAVDLQPNGSLIAASDINLQTNGTLANSGTIKAADHLQLAALDIDNSGGTVKSDGSTSLTATNDILNSSGIISGNTVSLNAGRDILNSTTTAAFNNNTAISQQGSISATGGDLTLTAGRDITINGAAVNATGSATINAANNLQVATVAATARIGIAYNVTNLTSTLTTGSNLTLQSGADTHLTSAQINAGNDLTATAGGNLTVDAAKDVTKLDYEASTSKYRNIIHDVDETVISSNLSAGGNISLSAVSPSGTTSINPAIGNLTLQAANVSTDTGTVTLSADQDVNLTAAHELDSTYNELYQKKSGFLSSKSTTSIDTSHTDSAVGTTISGDSVVVQSGHDLNLVGSNVAATNDVSLSATNNISVTTAEQSHDDTHFLDKKKSGLMGSGGIGFSIGTQKLQTTNDGQSISNLASTVGSLTGDVNITSGQDTLIKGSDLIAGRDINVEGRNVTLDASEDTQDSQQTSKFKQSGLTLSLTAPVIQTAQASIAAAERAEQVQDPKLQALYALRAAQDAVKTVQSAQDILKNGGDPASAFTLSLSIGSSKSSSQSSSAETTARGNTLTAGRDINLIAKGDNTPTSGDITARGVTATAAGDINLSAARDITLTSATNQSNSQSSNSSSSASIGVSISANGPALTANASAAKGNSNGADLTHTETTLNAGDTLNLEAGRDATLQGAIANGNSVIANIGRNLNLISEQDTSTYQDRQKSAGIGVSVGLNGDVSGNISIAKSNTDSNYQSVIEQTGINAGNGGFDINVNNNTDLKGAIISSTATPDSNQLTTGTLTTSNIDNHGQYTASSATLGFNAGGTLSTGVDKPAGGSKGGSGLDAGISGMAVADSGEASGTTKSAIANGSITITDNTQQQALTGNSAAQTIAALDRDTTNANGSIQNPFNQEQVAEQLEFLQVLGEDVIKPIAASAAKWIGDQFPADPNDPTKIDPAKLAAHAALGAAITTLLGAGWESGAAGGALGDVLPNILANAFEKDENGKIKNEQAFEAANAILAAMLVSGAGGNLAQIIDAGMVTKNAVENNYLTHQQHDQKEADLAKAATPAEKAAIEKKYADLDQQQSKDAYACLVQDDCNSVVQKVGLYNTMKQLEAICAAPSGCDSETQQSLTQLQGYVDGIDNVGEDTSKFLLETMGEIVVGGIAFKGAAALYIKAYPEVAAALGIGDTSVAQSVTGIEWGKGIQGQGMPWEDYLATELPAGSRLPPNFPTFDYFDRDTGLAISGKTLDTTTAAKVNNPSQVYYSLKGNIDAAESFTGGELSGTEIVESQITAREVDVAIPANTTPAQWTQINRAIDYAKTKGVVLKITKIK